MPKRGQTFIATYPAVVLFFNHKCAREPPCELDDLMMGRPAFVWGKSEAGFLCPGCSLYAPFLYRSGLGRGTFFLSAHMKRLKDANTLAGRCCAARRVPTLCIRWKAVFAEDGVFC